MSAPPADRLRRPRRRRPAPADADTELDEALFASLGIDDLLPEELAGWRPLARAALAFFVRGLPPARQTEILGAQFLLPFTAGPAERLRVLFGQCPSLHKLGQVLARHRGLPGDLRQQLQRLESLPPTSAAGAVIAAIRDEIGAPAELLIGDEILAEGSVAVVVPFTWREAGAPRHGVFKILKPGVEARLDEELAVFAALETFLARRGADLGLPALDYGDALGNVRRLLAREIRLDIEQDNLRAAAAFYAGEARLLIPCVLPWCSPRLTAMERVFGVPVTAARVPATTRRTLADTMITALLGQPFWSAEDQAVMHADLHAGNLMLADDGRLAVLDWSLTATLGKTQREAIVTIALGALGLDASAVAGALARLTGWPADDPALVAAIDRALDRLVAEKRLPGFDWLLALLDDLLLNGIRGFGEDLMLMRKSWMSLHGVLGDLVADASPDAQLLALGFARLLAEMPQRLIAAPTSAQFSTHVANFDLWWLCMSPGVVVWRYWARRG